MKHKANAAGEAPPENPAQTLDHSGHRARLRRQFLTSPESLTEEQLLELLLFYAIPRRDTRPLARQLLETYGSFKQTLCALPASLQQVEGMNEQAAVLLNAVSHGIARFLRERDGPTNILLTTEAAANYLMPRYITERDEVVYLLCFDAKCKLLDCRQLTRGSVNAAAIAVRKVMEAALACNATSVTLAHNHTSGLALPSVEDAQTTERVWLALRTVGIRLNDHMIFADGDYISLAEDGMMARLEREYETGKEPGNLYD